MYFHREIWRRLPESLPGQTRSTGLCMLAGAAVYLCCRNRSWRERGMVRDCSLEEFGLPDGRIQA